MAKQLYGYSSGTYGGGGGSTGSIYTARSAADSYLSGDTASRYLSADSQSALSSLYNPDNYSSRLSGISITTPTHSYGPPGVDAGSTAADSLYSGLKRTSAESKRPRYESTSHLPIYPQRPGEKDCAYYMQTRTCKFGDTCKFDHPIWVPEGGIPDWKEVPPAPSESQLPERPEEPDCPYFLKTQRCKFGVRCKFNHPKDRIPPSGALEDGDAFVLPERPSEPPCTFYMKTGKCKFGPTCKFHHPKGVQISSGDGIGTEVQNNIYGDATTAQATFAPASLHNTKGLPIRPGEEDCPFYLKTGSCKYGATCRYNHPDRYSAIASTLLTSPSAHFNLGLVAPASSLLSSFDSRLTQTTLGLGSIYPQRPGQLECDFYMKTGICKFGITCKFNHPIDRSKLQVPGTESQQENVKLTLAGLPRREGAIHCPYYMKTGTCKFGATCKFDHPPPGEVMAASTSQGTSSPAVGEEEEEGKENGDD
ncbi:zinc finger CCCH domain-containing protein 37 [Phtheirospermum japonicum]|uniref:Zinc finger CCCH domain-containing protein 37 n=1 Tax=Phtheirospermum japonicum TaxID=374723 RepID=A0A830D8U2_9LAMI|nr:zinc finger CCCH domain-containing protein 37 [Phtheirospermum japonicum]